MTERIRETDATLLAAECEFISEVTETATAPCNARTAISCFASAAKCATNAPTSYHTTTKDKSSRANAPKTTN